MVPSHDCSRDRRAPSSRAVALLLGALAASLSAAPARGAGPDPQQQAAAAWESAERIAPADLAKILKTAGAEKPVLLQVGFRVLYVQAHIPGSQYVGPGSKQEGIDALRKAVAPLPKTTPIVLYCGCCPWERCPNLKQPWTMLKDAGFTRVKLLDIPKNFGQDWVQKGYPVESGDPSRG